MEVQGEESPLRACCSSFASWCAWCSSCGRQHSYAQAFIEEGNDNRSASASAMSSPYRAPTQATSSSSLSPSNERSSLLPKATELNSTGSRQGPKTPEKHISSTGLAALSGKPPKWLETSGEQSTTSSTPRKEKKGDLIAKGKNLSGLSLAASEEGETCSTCLEPYSQENPAIWTKCNHHFHLACIYEWLERKQTCPICEREMSFEEIGC